MSLEQVPATSLEQGDQVFTPQGFWRYIASISEYKLAYLDGRIIGNETQPWKVLHIQHDAGGMVVFADSMIERIPNPNRPPLEEASPA